MLLAAYFLKLNEEHFHLDKSAALLAMGWASEVLNELSAVPPSPDQRRAGYQVLLSARASAYKRLRLYPIATELAGEAFTQMNVISSQVNIARVAQVHEQLSKSRYGAHPDVAALVIRLTTFWGCHQRDGGTLA